VSRDGQEGVAAHYITLSEKVADVLVVLPDEKRNGTA
jgi:hypothetical protein